MDNKYIRNRVLKVGNKGAKGFRGFHLDEDYVSYNENRSKIDELYSKYYNTIYYSDAEELWKEYDEAITKFNNQT
jgi:hypothetical protein